MRLADAQNISLEWLMRGEGPMYRTPPMAQASLVEEAVYKVETFLDERRLDMPARKKGELVAAVLAYMQRDIRDGTPWQQAEEFLDQVWRLRPDG